MFFGYLYFGQLGWRSFERSLGPVAFYYFLLIRFNSVIIHVIIIICNNTFIVNQHFLFLRWFFSHNLLILLTYNSWSWAISISYLSFFVNVKAISVIFKVRILLCIVVIFTKIYVFLKVSQILLIIVNLWFYFMFIR